MLDSQNRLQNYFKNAKTTKCLLELAFYTSKGRTCKVLSFYDFCLTFNDEFCSPYPKVDFYAYLITKIGNRNLKAWRNWPASFAQHQYLKLGHFCFPVSPVTNSAWRNWQASTEQATFACRCF